MIGMYYVVYICDFDIVFDINIVFFEVYFIDCDVGFFYYWFYRRFELIKK